jgi:hypothetical protein
LLVPQLPVAGPRVRAGGPARTGNRARGACTNHAFAFVGRQVHLEFASHDYYLDLLFYHLALRCYVVIELKAVLFDPAFIGQINVYLSAVDDLLRHPDDKPTIGLLLCRSKDRIVVEYALRDLKKPIGVAGWETKIVEKLPENLKGSLPTVEELEAELSREENER